MCKPYNGYTNYQSWDVALWIDNDGGSQEYWREACEEACKREGNRDDAVNDIRRQLQEQHEEFMPEVTGVYADLLTAALGDVDWYEIAENLVDGIEYEWPEEDEEEDDERNERKCKIDLATTTSGA